MRDDRPVPGTHRGERRGPREWHPHAGDNARRGRLLRTSRPPRPSILHDHARPRESATGTDGYRWTLSRSRSAPAA